MSISSPPNQSLTPFPFRCVHCYSPLSTLYQQYRDITNNSLLNCKNCNELADPYIIDNLPSILLDLLSFRREAYGHLLYNRKLENNKLITTVTVGGITLLLDAYTRCANEPINSFPLYLHSLLFCLIETILLHSSIIISTFLITKFFPTKFPPALHLIPLTLFYSCIPTLFILCISTLIYPSEYISDFEWTTKTSINLSDYSFSPPFMLLLSLLKKLGRSELKLKISRIGGIWAEETLVRKLVGGSSAIVGLSALIGSKGKTIVVLSLGWIIHLIFLNLLDGIFI